MEDGTKIWKKHGWYHRENEPAIIQGDGTLKWFQDGHLHREGGLPAIVYKNGGEEYHINGRLHREGGLPAVIDLKNNIREWWENGWRHRANGLPAVENNKNGIKEWWEYGWRHREGGLHAVKTKTRMEYWRKGVLHAERSSAIHEFGLPFLNNDEYWKFGKFISLETIRVPQEQTNILIGINTSGSNPRYVLIGRETLSLEKIDVDVVNRDSHRENTCFIPLIFGIGFFALLLK